MLLESQVKPKKKRLNEGNIFVTMVNPQAVYQKAVYVFLIDRLFRDKLLENVIRFAKACYEHKIIIITSCYVYRMWVQDDYEKFMEDCKLAWKALDL